MIVSYSNVIPQKVKVGRSGVPVRMYYRHNEWYVYSGTTKIECSDELDAENIYANL